MNLLVKLHFLHCKSISIGILLLAASSLSCGGSDQAPQISSSGTIEVIQSYWNSEDRGFRVYLGTFEVTSDEADLSKRRLAASQLSNYKSWEDAGLIKIDLRKDLTAQFSGWDDWNRLYLEGIQSVVHIEPTEKGMAMRREEENVEHAFLLISSGAFTIQNIIRNEPIKLGIDDYRVVLGTHVVNYTPEVQAYYGKAEASEQKKFRVLLKFDPFKLNWQVVAQDTADRDKEFPTDNINELLRRWRN